MIHKINFGMLHVVIGYLMVQKKPFKKELFKVRLIPIKPRYYYLMISYVYITLVINQ